MGTPVMVNQSALAEENRDLKRRIEAARAILNDAPGLGDTRAVWAYHEEIRERLLAALGSAP